MTSQSTTQKSNEDDEIYYISDQDSDDEKNNIKKIYKEVIKRYPKESKACEILILDHYKEFRMKFFERIKNIHRSYYRSIKNEIKNNLNSYRIYVSKKEKEN